MNWVKIQTVTELGQDMYNYLNHAGYGEKNANWAKQYVIKKHTEITGRTSE